MSAAEQTEIKPTSKKKKLIYSLRLLFFGTLFFSMCFLSNHIAFSIFFAFLKAQALVTLAILWLSLSLPPASPLFVFLFFSDSSTVVLLFSVIAAAACIPVLFWWLKIIKDDETDVIFVIYPIFVWILLGFGFTAFSLIYAMLLRGV
ncbi:MAG: hypothetical protein KA099_06400 [Alphaproteobacteria bacterium]|nr:hypothetical protein [Alphaproteobacteria bacterium]MBP7759906.1 hypothetical protein [Alphaproteobacteria bacterium]MBP7763251.1 hypothetical protein [Alphaproteobacteria bacterium]MBP7904940.1 hypothetical protein [Alphaproteobacteria bacterium]